MTTQISPNADGSLGTEFTAGASTISGVNLGTTPLGYAIKNGDAEPILITFNGQHASALNIGADWTAIAAAASTSGYDLYWSNALSGEFARWKLNSSGEAISGGFLSASELIAAEASLGFDLNADGSVESTFGIDPVTGIEQVTFADLGTVESDRVYTARDSITRQLLDVLGLGYTGGDVDNLSTLEVEFEFGRNYIIVTKVAKGDLEAYPLDYADPIFAGRGQGDWAIRSVVKGNFVYQEGDIKSATVSSVATQFLQMTQGGSFGTIYEFTNGRSIVIDSPNLIAGLDPFNSPDSPFQGEAIQLFYAENLVIPSGVQQSFGSPDLFVSELNTLGINQFFQAGWELNPFAPNLV